MRRLALSFLLVAAALGGCAATYPNSGPAPLPEGHSFSGTLGGRIGSEVVMARAPGHLIRSSLGIPVDGSGRIFRGDASNPERMRLILANNRVDQRIDSLLLVTDNQEPCAVQLHSRLLPETVGQASDVGRCRDLTLTFTPTATNRESITCEVELIQLDTEYYGITGCRYGPPRIALDEVMRLSSGDSFFLLCPDEDEMYFLILLTVWMD
jgi:hypothetical protein